MVEDVMNPFEIKDGTAAPPFLNSRNNNVFIKTGNHAIEHW
jgi:hypothetical protein